MEISYGNKTSTSRRRISLLSLAHTFDNDVICNVDHDRYIYIAHGLGPIFSFSTSYVLGHTLPTQLDCGIFFNSIMHKQKGPGNPKASLTKQAAMFITMIEEVLEADPDDRSDVVPSLHALQHCLRSGWHPDSIPLGILNAAISLAKETNSAAEVATGLLTAAMESGPALAQQLLLALLRSYWAELDGFEAPETPSESRALEGSLDKALCRFLEGSYSTLLVQAARLTLRAARNSAHGAGKSVSIDTLGLGENLEVLVGEVWVTGTIVRSNALSGEVHVEHPISDAADGRRAGAAGTTVSVLHKSSPRLRLLARGMPDDVTVGSADGANTAARTAPLPEHDKDQVAARMASLLSLVFGEASGAVVASSTRSSSRPRSTPRESKSSAAQLTPRCENGHTCTVNMIPPTSPGFMCAYCSKMYSSGPEIPLAEAEFAQRFAISRMECTLYKWSCPACRYDVCLSCFPHASYPKNGQFPFDYEEQLSAADSDPTPRRGTARAGRSEPYAAMMAGVTVTPTPDLNARTSVQRTICLMGSNESSYCKVRMEPSVQSAEISRVSHGSVIDVLDRPNCDFFQLVNNHGFVKKQPGRSAYWKRLSQDRYSHHEEDCAVEVCDTVELGAPCKPSAGSASEDQGIAQTPTSAALQAVERIIQYDNEQKARFASFAGAEGSDASKVVVLQDAQMSVLEAARTLFAMNAEPLGEIVVSGADCFEDAADDFFIASERVPLLPPALHHADGAAGVPLDMQHCVMALPAVPYVGFSSLLEALHQSAMGFRERLAALLVHTVFSIVVETLTGLAERRIASPDASSTPLEDLAVDILAIINVSENQQLLTAFFYRAMIARAAVRVKLSVAMFLNRRDLDIAGSVQPYMDAFKEIAKIEEAYKTVILHPRIGTTALFELRVTEKLQATILVVGYAALANGIIDQDRRPAGPAAASSVTSRGLKQALRMHILQPADRFALPSRSMRRLMKEVCQYGSEDSVAVLEGLWREVISDMVLEKCNESQAQSVALKLDYAQVNPEARSEGLVDFLVTALSDMRYISKMDMAVTNQCCMSADMAFETAFRRLPKEKSLELTKALVVRISSLIDAYKTHAMSRSWASAVDAITDLIQVLFAQSSAEFQHFYELLLARRLLRTRYISLSTEWRVLGLLPALSKSGLMIRDVEQTSNVMHAFRRYLVEQIDFQDLQLPQDVTELALSPHRLRVNVLTGDVWPTFWLQPLVYANLVLPGGLDLIKREFLRHFDAQDTNRYDSLNLAESFKPLQITGSEENPSRVNGIYDPTLEMSDGWPIYEMRDSASKSILEYSGKTSSWHIKKRTDRGKNAGWAYCKSPAKVAPDALEKTWYVWRKAVRKWVPQAIQIVTVTTCRSGEHFAPRAGLGSTSVVVPPATRSRSLRSIVWCHAAGTVTLQACLRDGSAVYLVVTEAQAAVLYSFNDMVSWGQKGGSSRATAGPQLSFQTLQRSLNLSKEELKTLLVTLMTPEHPVLETVKALSTQDISPDDSFQLSARFLDGKLGGADENSPIILSSIELDKHTSGSNIFDSELHSLHGWRNELVDACIVRVLKLAAAHKSGEFSNALRQRYTALPIDTLTYQVRSALKERCTVTAEDVIRRSERLVSVGIIDKVPGNSETFRSVAYCYLAESSAVAPVDEDTQIRASYVCDKVYGHDLYNHLRIVLGIKSNPLNAPGVPLSLFKEKFLTWMMEAQCDLSATHGSPAVNFLDLVPGLLVELVSAAVVQANALKLQFWHGIQNLCEARCPADTFYQLKGIDSLQTMSNVLRTSLSSSSPNIHNYLCLNRVYLEHFPAALTQDILNYFRGLLGEPRVAYGTSAGGGSEKVGGKSLQEATDTRRRQAGESEFDTGRFTPPEEGSTLGTLGGLAASLDTIAGETDGAVPRKLRQEILFLWQRTGSVRRDELVHVFGLSLPLLSSLNIIRLDSKNESSGPLGQKGSPLSGRGRAAGEGSSKEMVQITLQQLISAVLLRASETITESLRSHSDLSAEGTSFAQFLDESYFKMMVDTVANMFGTELHFADDVNVPETGASAGDSGNSQEEEADVDEVFIPCEFCTDSIRVSLFAAHTIACQAGRALPPNRRGAEAVARGGDARKPAGDKKEAAAIAPAEYRPHTTGPLGLSFVEAVLNAIVAAAADLEIPSAEYIPGADGSQTRTFTSFVESLFAQLDRDGDGFLTAADFAVVERSYADLLDTVDPTRLYGTRSSLVSSQKFTPGSKPLESNRMPTIRSFESLSDADLQELSTPIALGKVSSLWRSVSHEKSLPVVDASRSYAGSEETEQELAAIVRRVMSIIDDSEGASLSLLLHYKWDVKKLVEEVLENSRAVRFAVGLGPRSLPPFLRHDLFGTSSHSNSRVSTPFAGITAADPDPAAMKALCGICQDSVPSAEAFALNCRHWHCEDCWQGYVHNAINERMVTYCCPQPGCKFVVTQEMQKFLADDAHILEAKAVLTKSFVEDRRGKHVLATYCKNPRGCGGIVLLADDADYSEACCSLCATTFCAACDLPPHAPATCDMVAKWEEKGGYLETGRSEDVEARKLKHLTTKPCPKCGVRIEKSGGCPHMTCVQPSCRYQFCWECAGEYHTSTTCSRPKVKMEANAVLAFDEYDRQCANHFLARKVALKGKQESLQQLEQTQRQEEAGVLRVIAEGWRVLADAQSALAHTCIVMLSVKSAKLTFLFDCLKSQSIVLQQKFEEVWSVETLPLVEAKASIRDLRVRLRDYLLSVHAEIIVERAAKTVRPKSAPRGMSSPAPGRSPARGALGASSPSGRRSRSASVTRALSADAALEEHISAEDRPLLALLQQPGAVSAAPGEGLSAGMMVEVASTVFGDALGGSWRQYTPFLVSDALSEGMSFPAPKATPPPLKMPAIVPSSSPRMPPPPIRSFSGVTSVSFTPATPPVSRLSVEHGGTTATPDRDAGRTPTTAPLPSTWLTQPLLGDEPEEQSLHGFDWPQQQDNPDTKRPRK